MANLAHFYSGLKFFNLTLQKKGLKWANPSDSTHIDSSAYRDLLFTMSLCRGFLLCHLQGLLVYCVPLQGLLFYLFFFRSVKFCLYSPLSRNYVFEPRSLSCFRRILDSFTNCPKRTSICARILKIRICGFVTFFINDAFCKFLQINDHLNF